MNETRVAARFKLYAWLENSPFALATNKYENLFL